MTDGNGAQERNVRYDQDQNEGDINGRHLHRGSPSRSGLIEFATARPWVDPEPREASVGARLAGQRHQYITIATTLV